MSNLLATIQNVNVGNIVEQLNVENIKESFQSLQSKFSNIKSPQEFFDVRHFSKPSNFTELQQRVSYNLNYFQTNYILIILMLSIYALITNMLLLFVILLTSGGLILINKLRGENLTILNSTITTSQLYTTLMIIAIPLGFLASPISTMMWLIGSSTVCVFSHASFMEKPIETVFEEQV